MVLGITGGIGSGKSYVADIFCSHTNTCYYHADEEAKKLMNSSLELKNQMIEEFGEEAYQNNELNRTYLSSIVFKDPSLLKKLNSIVHPFVKNHFQNFLKEQRNNTIIIYENAILFEIGSDAVCDLVISVTAPLEERICRVIQRDNITREAVIDKIQNQWKEEKKNMLSNYLILNVNKKETLLKVQKIHNILTKNQLIF